MTLVAFAQDGRVTLEWTGAASTDRFTVLRSETEEGAYRPLHEGTLSAAETAGSALAKAGPALTYTDTTVVAGVTYYYLIERLTADGARTRLGPLPATPPRLVGQVGTPPQGAP